MNIFNITLIIFIVTSLSGCNFLENRIKGGIFTDLDHKSVGLKGAYYKRHGERNGIVNVSLNDYDTSKKIHIKIFPDHTELISTEGGVSFRTIPLSVPGYFIIDVYNITEGGRSAPCKRPDLECMVLGYASKAEFVIYAGVHNEAGQAYEDISALYRRSGLVNVKSPDGNDSGEISAFNSRDSAMNFYNGAARIVDHYKKYSFRSNGESIFMRASFMSLSEYNSLKELENRIVGFSAAAILGKLIWDALPSAPPPSSYSGGSSSSSLYSSQNYEAERLHNAQCDGLEDACKAQCEGMSTKGLFDDRTSCRSKCSSAGSTCRQ